MSKEELKKELNALSKALEAQHEALTRIDNRLQVLDDQFDAELLELQREENERIGT